MTDCKGRGVFPLPIDGHSEGTTMTDTPRKAIAEFELLDHGIENASYFQGCGLSHTEYDGIATGCGSNPAEAIDDALEQLACGDWAVEGMEARIYEQEGWGCSPPKLPRVRNDADDTYYVSIRVK